jgi:hypothetical protein
MCSRCARSSNLVCALTHLLDQNSPLLSAITNLINQINAILAGL